MSKLRQKTGAPPATGGVFKDGQSVATEGSTMVDAGKVQRDDAAPILPARDAFFETIDADEQAFLDEASVGELLRGARLTRGDFNIDAVAEELNIKKRVIDGIEMIDPTRLPKDVFLKNSIRAYVQYLKPEFPYPTEYAVEKFFDELTEARAKLAAEQAAARAEAQAAREAAAAEQSEPLSEAPKPFVLPSEDLPAPKPALPRPAPKKRHVIDDFAPPPPTPVYQPPAEPFWSKIAPALTAGAALAVVSGLAWGAWSLLEDIQRIGLQSPEDQVAELTVIDRRDGVARVADVARPSAEAYGDGGVLTQVYSAPKSGRGIDGPIADLSPRDVGAFRSIAVDDDPVDPAVRRAGVDPAATAVDLGSLNAPPLELETAGVAGQDQVVSASVDAGAAQQGVENAAVVLPPQGSQAAVNPVAPARDWRGPKLALHADGDIWVRVVDTLGVTIFIGNIADGEMIALPHNTGPLVLRTGNAGGTVLLLDGKAFGPVGGRGRVLTLEFEPSQIEAEFPYLPQITEKVRQGADAEPVRTAEPVVQTPENVQQ
ncbi:MAG: RodZ domain-containing protein [Pseudomonadota bacterium]